MHGYGVIGCTQGSRPISWIHSFEQSHIHTNCCLLRRGNQQRNSEASSGSGGRSSAAGGGGSPGVCRRRGSPACTPLPSWRLLSSQTPPKPAPAACRCAARLRPGCCQTGRRCSASPSSSLQGRVSSERRAPCGAPAKQVRQHDRLARPSAQLTILFDFLIQIVHIDCVSWVRQLCLRHPESVSEPAPSDLSCAPLVCDSTMTVGSVDAHQERLTQRAARSAYMCVSDKLPRPMIHCL